MKREFQNLQDGLWWVLLFLGGEEEQKR
jgi:hypothetical protein